MHPAFSPPSPSPFAHPSTSLPLGSYPIHILHLPSQIPFPRIHHYRQISHLPSRRTGPVVLPAVANHSPPLHRPSCLACIRVSETLTSFLFGGVWGEGGLHAAGTMSSRSVPGGGVGIGEVETSEMARRVRRRRKRVGAREGMCISCLGGDGDRE